MAFQGNFTSTESGLKNVNFGGLIREDVMNKIWDISKIPLPFTDSIGSDTAKQSYTEWTVDMLAPQDLGNATAENDDDFSDRDDTATGARVGNACQISVKHVPVSERANASDTIGRSNELAYQVMRRQQELRRDVEGIMLTGQGMVKPTSPDQSGKAAGFASWMVGDENTGTNDNGNPGDWNDDTGIVNYQFGKTYFAGVGGSSTGFDLATGAHPAITPGNARALTETLVRDAVEACYNKGGNPTKLMSTPSVIRKLSEYMFTASARIGTIMSDQGKSESKASALGAVNVFVSDFGTLTFVPNRLQPTYQSADGTPVNVAHVYIYDPEYVRQAFLQGYETKPLAKTGLMEKRLMTVDWTLKVMNPEAHAVIADVDPTQDVIAG